MTGNSICLSKKCQTSPYRELPTPSPDSNPILGFFTIRIEDEPKSFPLETNPVFTGISERSNFSEAFLTISSNLTPCFSFPFLVITKVPLSYLRPSILNGSSETLETILFLNK